MECFDFGTKALTGHACVQDVAIMPRDSLAEIMAVEQVLAAKQQLHACGPAGRFGAGMWGQW